MTPPFSVHTTPHRSLKKLIKRHPNLGDRYAEAVEILNIDPKTSAVLTTSGSSKGSNRVRGSTGLRLGRWRFRYDIYYHEVWLFQCSLRREESYR